MKCIDENMIQKFIDGETNSTEDTFINEHISNCDKCFENISNQRELANNIKRAINKLGNDEIDFPEFKAPVAQQTTIKKNITRFIYTISAACILILFFFILHNQDNSEQEKIILIYNLESDFNANLPVSEQDMVIQIIDSEGNFTTY